MTVIGTYQVEFSLMKTVVELIFPTLINNVRERNMWPTTKPKQRKKEEG